MTPIAGKGLTADRRHLNYTGSKVDTCVLLSPRTKKAPDFETSGK